MAAKYIALASTRFGQQRMPLTVNGRLVVDTEQAWNAIQVEHEGLIRVPADTLGFPVSMLCSPAGRTVAWWHIEDAADE